MKSNITNVALSFLCPQDWNSMENRSNERFCKSCNRGVKDFRNATQEDLEHELSQSNGRVCGRFKKSQMSSTFLKYAATTALLTTLNGCTPEQITPAVEQPSEKVIETEFELELMGDVAWFEDDDSLHILEIYQPDVFDLPDESLGKPD